MNLYSRPETDHTFNYLLNGRWHSGDSCDFAGQMRIEHALINKSCMNRSSKVLDIGSGNGVVSCDYHLLTGASVTGLTNELRQWKQSTELTKRLQIQARVNFDYWKDTSKLPYSDSTYDIVIFTESLCHIKDKSALIAEIYRVLRPGGCLVGEDWAMSGNSDTASVDTLYGTHLISPRDYLDILKKNGFDKCEVSTIKPNWCESGIDLLRNVSSMCYHMLFYPKLPIRCPYPVNYNKLDYRLIQSGRVIEANSDFRLVLIYGLRPGLTAGLH